MPYVWTALRGVLPLPLDRGGRCLPRRGRFRIWWWHRRAGLLDQLRELARIPRPLAPQLRLHVPGQHARSPQLPRIAGAGDESPRQRPVASVLTEQRRGGRAWIGVPAVARIQGHPAAGRSRQGVGSGSLTLNIAGKRSASRSLANCSRSASVGGAASTGQGSSWHLSKRPSAVTA